MKRLIRACCFLIPVTGLLFSSACGRKKDVPPADPGPAPTVSDFVLKNLVSEFPGEIRTADYSDQVQLVIFLRSDDAGCRGSIAAWNSLGEEFGARGFISVGAIVDDRPAAEIAAEVVQLHPGFPIGLADARLVEAFGGARAIRAIPTAFLLSRAGVPLRTYAGYVPPETLRADIALALDNQPLAPPAPKQP